MAVCLSKSVGEFFADFMVALSAGKQNTRNPWGMAEKRKSNLESQSRKSKVVGVVYGLVGETA